MSNITLGELKEMIDDLVRMEDDDVLEMEVFAEYDYGDHCHTTALTRISKVNVKTPYESAYSDSGLAVRDEEEADMLDGCSSPVITFGDED